MAIVACPECDTHVTVPDGTRKGVEVGCPSCNASFLTPELPGAKPEPVTAVGGRSDYLDADAFTPVRRPPKPKRPPVVISGWVTVCFIVGSVLIASVAGGSAIYGTLKIQGRVAEGNAKGGNPIGKGGSPALPEFDLRPERNQPAEPPATDPASPQKATDPVGPADPAPPGFTRPVKPDEAWAMLVGTWKLVEKPPVEPVDEPSLLKLTFAADNTAVLTDNLFEHSKGQSPNYEDQNAVTRVAVRQGRITLHLRQTAGDQDQTLALTIDDRDRITVYYRPREAGPTYHFRFARVR